LATSSSVADSNERTETGRAIPLFKAVLQELPQTERQLGRPLAHRIHTFGQEQISGHRRIDRA
jgi:hypothetical protein